MRPQEADLILERFLDAALVANAHAVEIIHGKGTGALRRLVHDKLKEYRIREVSQPTDQHGGSGSTIVTL
jgi:DNA mismatch repair protein MutS2